MPDFMYFLVLIPILLGFFFTLWDSNHKKK